MRKLEPVNYLELRPNNLNSDRFRHLWLVLFWPMYGIMFRMCEADVFATEYMPVYSKLDDLIPFNELFVIPYLFWFIYLTGSVVFNGIFDVEAFKREMYFIITAFSITTIIYIVYPTCQELRPLEFERDNILTRFMAGFYEFDTNTNVCPSLHVIGSVASMFGCLDSKYIKGKAWTIANIIVTILISASTVFLKQHSIVDVYAAIPVCVIGWLVAYRWLGKKRQKND